MTAPGWAITYVGARPTVHIMGRIDRVVIGWLRGAIRGLRASGAVRVAVDVSAVSDCDSRLLRALADARALLVDDAGSLTIVGLRLPQFVNALRTAGLDETFVVYDALRRPAESRPPEGRNGPRADGRRERLSRYLSSPRAGS